MDVWTGVGIFLLGAGLGGFITGLSFYSQIQRLKADVLILNERHRIAAPEHSAAEDRDLPYERMCS